MKKIDRSSKVRTGFHQAKWDEPVIFELTKPGERGILVLPGASGDADSAVAQYITTGEVGDPNAKCDHHEHGEGHTCGEHDHGCGGHCHE